MTSSSSVELTAGQRCLLDLLQRKLLNTIQSYARLSLEKQQDGVRDGIEIELLRLKEKIRRISARQKRFTLEIINGNGNNTIPKESFFEALGLVTKEALSKLNSKTNERRRRTTANPRFSHEAIQAKRALEPLQKRLESRVRDNKRESSRKPQRNQPEQSNNNNINSTTNSSARNNININNNNNSGRGFNQQAFNNSGANNNARSSSRINSSRNNRANLIQEEHQELLVRFEHLQDQIKSKVNQIKDKRESNKRLERQNELIRKRGLDIISAINMINPDITFQDDVETNQLNAEQTNHSRTTEQTVLAAEPLDIWIDMKCDESLDGLD